MEARPSGKVSARAIILLAAIALAVLVVDQLAKWWVIGNLPYRVPREVLGSLLIFQYDRNPGAAFSIGTGSTWIFSIVAVAVLVFVIWYARRIRSMVWALVFGLVLGGLLGNLTDRLIRPPGFGVGEVVDFLRIPLLPAIFNLADSAIVCAMILFLILTVMGVGLDGRRAVRAASTGRGDAAGGGPAHDGEEDPAAEPASAEPAASHPTTTRPAPSETSAPQEAEGHDQETHGTGEGGGRAESRRAGLDEARHPVDGYP